MLGFDAGSPTRFGKDGSWIRVRHEAVNDWTTSFRTLLKLFNADPEFLVHQIGAV